MFTKTETEGHSICMLLWKLSRLCRTLINFTARLVKVVLYMTVFKKCKLIHFFSYSKVQCKNTSESQIEAGSRSWGQQELCLFTLKGCWKACRNKMSCTVLPDFFLWLSEHRSGIYSNTCVRIIPHWILLKYIVNYVTKPGMLCVESLFLKKYRNFLLCEWWEITI